MKLPYGLDSDGASVCGHRKTKVLHPYCCGRMLSQASASLPFLTKQETESACGGKGAIKFYEGLKLQSAPVSQ